MSTSNTRATRLLDRGFYPVELPPVFTTKNFSSALTNLLPRVTNPHGYHTQLIHFDGSTYQGNLRTFGVINPVNYSILSYHIAKFWPQISDVFKLTSCSGARPKFPAKDTEGRAIHAASMTAKRRNLEHLASSFPQVLSLDINRFYGSVYTHSIPWAALGKSEAKRRFSNRSLSGHWSDQLDLFARNCNSKQTIGLPIGPDTSRIISEMLLARIDLEILNGGSFLSSDQLYHNIDDYQFGIISSTEAEAAQSSFVGAIQKYELRVNDFKTRLQQGISFAPSNWQRLFDQIGEKSGARAVEAFFDLVYSVSVSHPSSNVVGYSLKRFSKQLASNPKRELVIEYLQRLLFAAPYHARWVLPLWLGLLKSTKLTSTNKRAVRWGIEVSARRADIGTLLWYLYAAIFAKIKIGSDLTDVCSKIGNPLVDLMLYHGKSEKLFSLQVMKLRLRYQSTSLQESGWLPLYEIERRGWDTTPAFQKIGTDKDSHNCFKHFDDTNVEFYNSSQERFEVTAFESWHLADENFEEDDDNLDWDNQFFGREFESDEVYN